MKLYRIIICIIFALFISYSMLDYIGNGRELNKSISCSDGKQIGEQALKISLEDEQYKRQIQLRHYCKNITRDISINHNKRPNIFYSDEYSLAYCAVPKVASTNWKRVFQTLKGVIKHPKAYNGDIHVLHLPSFQELTSEEIQKRINIYYTFLIVRHPFHRIVSAYRNKFEDPYTQAMRKLHGSKILRLFRQGLTEKEYAAGLGVTFSEFAKYIVHSTKVGDASNLEPHWRGIVYICPPCSMKYNYIGEMETLVADTKVIRRQAGWVKDVEFPEQNNEKYNRTSTYYMVKYMRKLSNHTINQLLHVYKNDLLAFGYKMNENWRPIK